MIEAGRQEPGSGLPSFPDIARVPPQHALQLLVREAATEVAARVLLGALDERLAHLSAQTREALPISVGRPFSWSPTPA